MKKITIAIDGHSSCGKSTMAKDLAREIGYIYVDSGAMYRACTLYAMQHELISADGTVRTAELEAQMPQVEVSFSLNPTSGQPDTYLNGECVEAAIRTMEVSNLVSHVAALPFVREAMTRLQQQMGEAGGIVMDGRDIGTAVFPHAELKFFVTASDEIRAQRRFDELKAKGQQPDFDAVLRNLRERDHIDSTRAVNPLRQADDALVLDNSHMTKDEQREWLLERFKERIAR